MLLYSTEPLIIALFPEPHFKDSLTSSAFNIVAPVQKSGAQYISSKSTSGFQSNLIIALFISLRLNCGILLLSALAIPTEPLQIL